jgi:hypothetical protein
MKNNITFINELVKNFPNLQKELLCDDNKGVITLQIGCFKRFTQEAIDNNDLDIVKRCFDFVDTYINDVEHRTENALVVSYLGKLKIPVDSVVENLLSKKLKKIILELNKYYTSSPTNKKLKDFLNSI